MPILNHMVKPIGLDRNNGSRRKPTPKVARKPAVDKAKQDRTPAASSEGETEQRILTAARAEFISKGLAGARMQVIATQAGVNKALLHYYFRSKNRLYQTVLKNIIHSVWTTLRKEISLRGPDKDLESLVRTFVTTYTRTLAANPDFPLFVFQEISSGADSLPPLAKDIFRDFAEVPAALIHALNLEIKSGKIRPIPPLHFFMNMVGMCVATFVAMPVLRKIGPGIGLKVDFNEAFLNDRIETITTMIFHGIRNTR